MTTKLKIAPLALALGLMAATPTFAQSSTTQSRSAQSSTAQRGLGALVGVWRMTSLEVGTLGNLRPVPYSGQIVFTTSGTMSVQAMNPDRNAPNTPYTVNGYEAFYGTISPGSAAGTFVVTVRSSLARDLIGQRLTRVFNVSGRTLVLTPPNPAEGWRATYERL